MNVTRTITHKDSNNKMEGICQFLLTKTSHACFGGLIISLLGGGVLCNER